MDEQSRFVMRARGLGGGLVLLYSVEAFSQTSLQQLDTLALAGGKDELRLVFAGSVPEVSGFATDNPARIALDMPQTVSALDKYIPVDLANVRSVAVIESDGRTRMVLSLVNPVEYNTWIQDNTLYVRLGDEAPVVAEALATGSAVTAQVPAAGGADDKAVRFALQESVPAKTAATPGQPAPAEPEEERISLDFQDIAVRDVLQILADFRGFNLVASDTVNGSITLRLKDVPWSQALDIVLSARGLGKRQRAMSL